MCRGAKKFALPLDKRADLGYNTIAVPIWGMDN